MTIKQNKSQTILYATITLLVAAGLFCFVIFDMRKLPHDYSFVLDNAGVYWLFKVLCLIGGFFSAAGGVYLFKQMLHYMTRCILSYECILVQQFCTLTQKSLIFKGFSCF